MTNEIRVCSEIAPLRKVLIHSPDGGIGNVPVEKLHDWLYDDIVDVKKIQMEHRYFHLLLLAFLSPERLFVDGEFVLDKETKRIRKNEKGLRAIEMNPEKIDYYLDAGDIDDAMVIDTQYLLQHLIHTNKKVVARDLIVAISALERINIERTRDLIALLDAGYSNRWYHVELTKTLLTGRLDYGRDEDGKVQRLKDPASIFIFPPIPNFIFTRDIGVSFGDHLLITKPKYSIRMREVMLFRFLAENHFCKDNKKIISVTEDDNFFQIPTEDQDEYSVSYEGGDIMMISDRHVLAGCSERTSPYAVHKLAQATFWADIKTKTEHGVEILTVIRIDAKRSQMHIDTVMTHLREDVWVLFGPLSERWQAEQVSKKGYYTDYKDELSHKVTANTEPESEVSLFQFYLNPEAKEIKRQYLASNDPEEKARLKKLFHQQDFLLRADEQGNYDTDCIYQSKPKGLHDFLCQISVKEFGVANEDEVTVLLSGGGQTPFDTREQWTDSCNLLTLRPGVSIGYDRNYETAKHFNVLMMEKGEAVSDYPEFIPYISKKNRLRFKKTFNSKGEELPLQHVIHVEDLLYFISDHDLNQEQAKTLIDSIKNSIILLHSSELSRARGGSHCMSMPLYRKA